MNSNTQKAKEILKDGNYTLVLYNGNKNETLTSTERGVKPLLSLLSSGKEFSSYSASDRVVGSAAAYLYVLLGIKEVFALTVSENAKSVFQQYGIAYTFDNLVPYIINRSGDRLCPMEKSTLDAKSPEDALLKIKNKLKELSV